jgi:hypothetical protein
MPKEVGKCKTKLGFLREGGHSFGHNCPCVRCERLYFRASALAYADVVPVRVLGDGHSLGAVGIAAEMIGQNVGKGKKGKNFPNPGYKKPVQFFSPLRFALGCPRLPKIPN